MNLKVDSEFHQKAKHLYICFWTNRKYAAQLFVGNVLFQMTGFLHRIILNKQNAFIQMSNVLT